MSIRWQTMSLTPVPRKPVMPIRQSVLMKAARAACDADADFRGWNREQAWSNWKDRYIAQARHILQELDGMIDIEPIALKTEAIRADHAKMNEGLTRLGISK